VSEPVFWTSASLFASSRLRAKNRGFSEYRTRELHLSGQQADQLCASAPARERTNLSGKIVKERM
jgi:hypothetical protein